MANLPIYSDFNNKDSNFKNGKKQDFRIKTIGEFDSLLKNIRNEGEKEVTSSTNVIYRGMNEAKYKLYTSSQREWITNNMSEWGTDYFDFITKMVVEAKNNPLIKKVFDLYDYSDSDREFPILSLLQHYGAPTPLMDWTYNINVALFFALDGLQMGNVTDDTDSIDNYFSLYRIVVSDQSGELSSVVNPPDKKYKNGSIKKLEDINADSKSNKVYYVSDFKKVECDKINENDVSRLKLKLETCKPLTSIYNQNIIPQEGLFLFNLYEKEPIENFFNKDWSVLKATDDYLTGFECYNIHKDLGEYLKRRLNLESFINQRFIYPNLDFEIDLIKENVLNYCCPIKKFPLA